MNDRVGGSNVYYLSAGAAPLAVPRSEPQPGFGRRLRHAWWRFRLALTEIRAILFRPRRRLTASDYAALLDPDDSPAPRVRPRPARPAAVIDFAAARARRRPPAEA